MLKRSSDLPMVKLLDRIKESEHKLSKEETKALIRCRNHLAQSAFEGSMLGFIGGYIGWRKARLLPRLLVSSGLAVVSGGVMKRWNHYGCIQMVLQLEDSQLTGELVHILKEDSPNHSALKDFMRRRHEGGPQLEFDEEGAKGLKRLPPKVDVLSSDQDHVWGQDRADHSEPARESKGGTGAEERGGSERLAALARTAASGGNRERELEGGLRQQGRRRQAEAGAGALASDVEVETDILGDPFAFPGPQEDEMGEPGETRTDARKVRKSRMSRDERREANRKQFQEWTRKKAQEQGQTTSAGQKSWSQARVGGSSFGPDGLSFRGSGPQYGVVHAMPLDSYEKGRDGASGAFDRVWYATARKVLRDLQTI